MATNLEEINSLQISSNEIEELSRYIIDSFWRHEDYFIGASGVLLSNKGELKDTSIFSLTSKFNYKLSVIANWSVDDKYPTFIIKICDEDDNTLMIVTLFDGDSGKVTTVRQIFSARDEKSIEELVRDFRGLEDKSIPYDKKSQEDIDARAIYYYGQLVDLIESNLNYFQKFINVNNGLLFNVDPLAIHLREEGDNIAILLTYTPLKRVLTKRWIEPTGVMRHSWYYHEIFATESAVWNLRNYMLDLTEMLSRVPGY